MEVIPRKIIKKNYFIQQWIEVFSYAKKKNNKYRSLLQFCEIQLNSPIKEIGKN